MTNNALVYIAGIVIFSLIFVYSLKNVSASRSKYSKYAIKIKRMKKKDKKSGGSGTSGVGEIEGRKLEFELSEVFSDTKFLEFYNIDRRKIDEILRKSVMKKCKIIINAGSYSSEFLKYFLKYMILKIFLVSFMKNLSIEEKRDKSFKDVLSVGRDEILIELKSFYEKLRILNNETIKSHEPVSKINEHFGTRFTLNPRFVFKFISCELNDEDFYDIYSFFENNSCKRILWFLMSDEVAYSEYGSEWINDHILFSDERGRIVGWVEIVKSEDNLFRIIRPVKNIFMGEKLFVVKFILSLVYIFMFKSANVYGKSFLVEKIKTYSPVVGGMDKYKYDSTTSTNDGFIYNCSEIMVDRFMDYVRSLNMQRSCGASV